MSYSQKFVYGDLLMKGKKKIVYCKSVNWKKFMPIIFVDIESESVGSRFIDQRKIMSRFKNL